MVQVEEAMGKWRRVLRMSRSVLDGVARSRMAAGVLMLGEQLLAMRDITPQRKGKKWSRGCPSRRVCKSSRLNCDACELKQDLACVPAPKHRIKDGDGGCNIYSHDYHLDASPFYLIF